MDYLEGFLIGPVWSDTDYRSRRHFSAHVFLAAMMAVAFVLLTLYPNLAARVIVIKWPLPPILLIILLLLNPFISILYRRLPFFVRPLLLLIYLLKYLLLFYWLVHVFTPLVTFEKESFLSMLYARMDSHIEVSLEKIAESGGIFVTVAGVLAGGLWVIAEGLAVVAILVIVPLLAIFLCKSIQYLIDRGTKYLLDRELERVASFRSSEIGGATTYEEMTAVKEPAPPIRKRSLKVETRKKKIKTTLSGAAAAVLAFLTGMFRQLRKGFLWLKEKIASQITRVTNERKNRDEGDTIKSNDKEKLCRRK